MKTMTESEVVEYLRKTCDRAGSVKKWATANGISYSYISAVLRGEKPLTDRILKIIGVKKTPQMYVIEEKRN